MNPIREMIFAVTYSVRVTDRERIESAMMLDSPLIVLLARMTIATTETGTRRKTM